jgi:hypothetical protein
MIENLFFVGFIGAAVSLGACFISRVIRFVPIIFVCFSGFEGEYLDI